MLENLKNLGSIMKMAGQMKERAAELQAELERRTVQGESGGGAVRVTANGRGRILRIELDEPVLGGIAGDDKEVVEELIAAAVNVTLEKVQRLAAEEMSKLTGGMNIPGLSDLLDQQSQPE